ncbi:MAG TPA: hypothetical protein VF796_22510 [Humisphaera sp.]
MFAVMILGIGFVMIAGVFPVSLRNIADTADETNATAVARGASARLATVVPWADVAPTDGAVVSLRQASPGAWRQVAGEFVWNADPRYAWVPLVRFAGVGEPAQAVIVVLRSRDGRRLGPGDLVSPDPASGAPPVLEPLTVTVTLTDGGQAPDTVEFDEADARAAVAAGTGALLVVSSDQGDGRSNGRGLRLGRPLDDAGRRWELQPGSDLAGPQDEAVSARAYLVGRDGLDRGVDAVAAYTTMFVPR